MKKRQVFFTIFVSVILALAVNIFFGRLIVAKVSTWPLLNRLRLLSPQAPIVITNNQTVRISDSGDIGQIAQQVKSKLASVVLVGNGSVSVVGSAVNLTSDGSFVTAASAFGTKAPSGYFIVLSDGTEAAISQITPDPATSLAFFKASLNSVPVQNLGNSANVAPGDKMFFVQNSLQNFIARATESIAVFSQADVEGQVIAADYPRRSFGLSSPPALLAGEAILDSSGNIEGIFNGTDIISADVLKTAMNLYFNNPAEIIRPSFGFSYFIVTQNDSRLANIPQGALVKSVIAVGSAHAAGLQIGDIITAIDGQNISETNFLEPLLENYKPGDTAVLTVSRSKAQVSLKLKVGQLK